MPPPGPSRVRHGSRHGASRSPRDPGWMTASLWASVSPRFLQEWTGGLQVPLSALRVPCGILSVRNGFTDTSLNHQTLGDTKFRHKKGQGARMV